MKLRFYISILVFTFFAGCRKDPSPVKPITVINLPGYDDMKAYAYFKVGTYWVYEDSLNPGNIDSVWVSQSMLGYDTVTQPNGGVQPGIYPYFGVQTEDIANNTRDYSCFSKQAYFGTSNGRLSVSINWNTPQYYYGIYYLMTNRFTPNDSLYYKDPSTIPFNGYVCRYISSLDSLTTNNLEFNNIVIFKNIAAVAKLSGEYHKYYNNIYLAKNIGIIRRVEVDSNRIWNLKRYNVIQ